MTLKKLLLTCILCSSQMLLSAKDDLNLGQLIQPLKQEGIFKTESWFNWGCSIIKGKDGLYYNFYSRWPKAKGFGAWLTHSEIALASSTKPTGPWKYIKTVLKGRGAGHWDELMAHNPRIEFFDGKYHLYYISSTQQKTRGEIRNSQRTGLATSDTILGNWTRLDKPIIQPKKPIYTVTVNPAVVKSPEGKYLMIIKGDNTNKGKKKLIQAMASADSPKGPWTIQEKPVIDDIATEDISFWYDKNRRRYYAVFHVHGGNFIGMITSEDGINWTRAKNFKVCPKRAPLAKGGFLKVSRFERPYVYAENGQVKMLSFAVKKGNNSFSIYMDLAENLDKDKK